MKPLKSFFAVIAALIPLTAASQQPLPDSPRWAGVSHVYRLAHNDLKKIHIRGRTPDESMLHTFVASYESGGDVPELPRGNYIVVRLVGSELVFYGHTVDDLGFCAVDGEEAMLFVHNRAGEPITDAKVSRNGKKLRFDPATGTYNAESVREERVFEIENDGVYHYIEFDGPYGYRARGISFRAGWYKFRNFFRRTFGSAPVSGFVVFSKPKYRPGETVRLKAYIANDADKAYRGDVNLRLKSWRAKKDTVIATLTPYRPGMYEFEFGLTDSLGLMLDQQYTMSLERSGRKQTLVSGYFYYEEYELRGVTFTATAAKDKYYSADEVRLELKAVDENGMPVYDGRAEITVRAAGTYRTPELLHDTVFIPNTLWKHTVDMTGRSTAEVALPDSIFPAVAEMQYAAECVFLTSDNERYSRNVSFERDGRRKFIRFDADVKGGTMNIRMVDNGSGQQTAATVGAYDRNGETIWEKSVTLPYSFTVGWNEAEYDVAAGDVNGYHRVEQEDMFSRQPGGEKPIDAGFARADSGIVFTVNNKGGIPVWYKVKRGDKVIDRGWSSDSAGIEKRYPDSGKDPYSVLVSYLYGGKTASEVYTLPYARKNIEMEVATPSVVYPGQTADVEVSVKDKKGRPVGGADITAYAYTSKFDAGRRVLPSLRVYGKWKTSGFSNVNLNAGADELRGRTDKLSWERWHAAMGLDTIEFYKFLLPEPFYTYSEPDPDGVTQISPYVVTDGRLQGPHIVLIDGQPHFFSQAQQRTVYSFPVTPGNHSVVVRTHDHRVRIDSVYAAPGMRTIVSADGSGSKQAAEAGIAVEKLKLDRRGLLTKTETEQMRRHMISFDYNFGKILMPNGSVLNKPGYIVSGGVLYNLYGGVRSGNGSSKMTYQVPSLLVGPFPQREAALEGGELTASVSADGKLLGEFVVEGGNNYWLSGNSVRRSAWDDKCIEPAARAYRQSPAFGDRAYTEKGIADDYRNVILSDMEGRAGAVNYENPAVSDCVLKLQLGNKAGSNDALTPMLIYVVNTDAEGESAEALYYGGTRIMNKLWPGRAMIYLIFRDNTVYHTAFDLKQDGVNHVRIADVLPSRNDGIAALVSGIFNSMLMQSGPADDAEGVFRTTWADMYYAIDETALPAGSLGSYRESNRSRGMVTGIVTDAVGSPLPGAAVNIAGTSVGTISDSNGRFELNYIRPTRNGEPVLHVSYLGFRTVKVGLAEGYHYNVVLREDYHSIESVVVTGLSGSSSAGGLRLVKRLVENESSIMAATGTATIYSLKNMDPSLAVYGSNMTGSDPNSLPDIELRGSAAFTERISGIVWSADGGSADFANALAGASAGQLVILNGKPYNGDVSNLDVSRIASIEQLEGGEAVAKYGPAAANGVVIIMTRDVAADDEALFGGEANSLRRNFRDDAFWQPRLTTGEDGKAKFSVTYPDDITKWTANFIAHGRRKQSDLKQISVNSFKTLSAKLAAPQFAVAGDSFDAIGKITSYGGEVSVEYAASVDEAETKGNADVAASHVDKIPVKAAAGDSIRIAYSAKVPQNGYFDGEERVVPVYPRGMVETKGAFALISDDREHTFDTDPALGQVTVHAAASDIDVLLDEIDKVDRYAYYCNEQMASKLKALIAKKRIYRHANRKFGDDGNIRELIRKLDRNRNEAGLWGWWGRSDTSIWISLHVLEALSVAGTEGFDVGFRNDKAASWLDREFRAGVGHIEQCREMNAVSGWDVRRLEQMLMLMTKFNKDADGSAYFLMLEKALDGYDGADMVLLEARSVFGSVDGKNLEKLLAGSRKSIMGGMFWTGRDRNNLLPCDSDAEATLRAYRILRRVGGHEKELELIRNYFYETRKEGSWRNIYESSRIIETIIPDILAASGGERTTASMTLNGTKITKLPYTATLPAGATVTVSGSGSVPLFFTAYQQFRNEAPERRSKGIAVETWFGDVKNLDMVLKAGEVVTLNVKVSMDSDAEYVMVEVPIPAGCSYESKANYYRSGEYREYFKEKVVICLDRLGRGTHRFSVRLVPRFTGSYSLNPARAELMYYPTLFGRESIREVRIDE